MNQCTHQSFIQSIKKFCNDNQQTTINTDQSILQQNILNFLAIAINNNLQIYVNKQKSTQSINNKPINNNSTQIDLKSLISDILKLQSKLKYPVSLFTVFILTKNKQKPLSIILGFYYQVVNSLVKQLKKDIQDDKKIINNKRTQQQISSIENIRKISTEILINGFQLIIKISKHIKQESLLYKQNKQQNNLSNKQQIFPKLSNEINHIITLQSKSNSNALKTSKIYKILASILCIPQNYLPPSLLITSILTLSNYYTNSEEVLSKIEYKLVKKLQEYQDNKFTQNDIVNLLKILLFKFQHTKTGSILDSLFNLKKIQNINIQQNIRPRHSIPENIQEEGIFFTQFKRKKLSILIQILSNPPPSKSQAKQNSQHLIFGYHITCFIVKIVSNMLLKIDETEILFLKQFIIYLSTTYLHNLQSFATQKQTIKFYNTIIASLIKENNVFILKVCLNFIHNQAIMGFSVDKLKSLFKLLTQIAKKLKKMEANGQKSTNSVKSTQSIGEQIIGPKQQKNQTKRIERKQIISQNLINEQVELAKLKISRIIRIFQQLTQRYRDKCFELIFSNAQQSKLSLQKIKQSNSVIFSLRINDKRKSYFQIKNQEQRIKISKIFIQQNEHLRLIKFVIGKSQNYQIFIKIRPIQNIKQSNKLSNSSFIKVNQENNLLNQLLLNHTSYIVDIVVCLDQKVLLEDHIKSIQKIADSYFQFIVCLSCNKSNQQKGSTIFIKINEKLIQINSKQKRNQITSFQMGLQCKSQLISKRLNSSVKNLYFFSKQIPQQILQKHDFSSLTSSMITQLVYILTSQSITYRVHQSPQYLIQDINKEQKIFFKKQLKITSSSFISKNRSLSFIQIFEQIGGLNSIFYILDKINNSYAGHFGQKTQHFFVEIFKILKNLASNDKDNFIFKEVKRAYEYICHFLFLIFRRNQHLANQRNCHFVESIFKFLMFFSSQFTKDHSIKNYPADQVFQMQLIFIKQVLCHFEMWSECSLEIQSYVFETLQSFIRNDRYTLSLFSIDLHSKILTSMTFFYCHELNPLKNKFQQKILLLCEQLYDRVYLFLDDKSSAVQTMENLQLLVNMIKKVGSNKNAQDFVKKQKSKSVQKKNDKQATKKDFQIILERYIHRDINQTISLIYLLIVYHSKHFNDSPMKKDQLPLLANSNVKQRLNKSHLKTLISSFNQSFSGSKLQQNSNLSFTHLPAQLKTCSNIIAYFIKNFIDKDHTFCKINDDWAYVLAIISVLQQILLQTKVKSIISNYQMHINTQFSCEIFIIIKLYELMFKIIIKKQEFFNYIINTLQRLILFPNISLINVFCIISEILNLNKKFNFDIVDTIFFLVNKKLNSYEQKEKIIQIAYFCNEPQLQKILYKMADVSLTYSLQFDDFTTALIKQISSLNTDYFIHPLIKQQQVIFQQQTNKQKQNELISDNNHQTHIEQEFLSQETIIDQFHIIQNQMLETIKKVQQVNEIQITKSKQSLLRLFTQFEDILFSICYQTGIISQSNRQWIQKFFEKKFCIPSPNKDKLFTVNILKQKRINSQSNFQIGYFCSTEETVQFMLNLLQRLSMQQKIDTQDQKTALLNTQKKQLSEIKQSPMKENTISISSKTGGYSQSYIDTQQKINLQITSILTITQPISFFLSSPKNSISLIYKFFMSLQQFQILPQTKYSFFCQKDNLTLLNFVKMFSYGQGLKYLYEKYSYNEQNQSEAQKPIQAQLRKQITLKCIKMLKFLFFQNLIDFQGLYNCLVSQSDILFLQNTKSTFQQLSSDKITKSIKDINSYFKKFLQSWYMNNSLHFKVNPHDRDKLKVPKKLNLEQKNLFDILIQKIRFVCLEIENEELIMSQIFTFFQQQSKSNTVKQFISLMNRIIATLKWVLQLKRILTILQNLNIFKHQPYLLICPKNPSSVLAQKIIQEYRQTLIQKFNKILQYQRKKSQKSESQFKKNQKKNQFWLEIQEKDYQRKNQIYQLDQKQIGPFGFYKLNIKPSTQNIQQIHYPRKKMFASIKSSQSQIQNELEQSIIDSVILAKTRILDLNFLDTQNSKERRNTLLEISPLRNTINNLEGITNLPNQNNGFFWCQLVTKRGVYAGKLFIKSQFLEFKYVSHLRLPNETVYRLSTGKFHQINSLSNEQQLKLSPLKIPFKRCKLLTRRYILRHTAIELFSKLNHQSYFINLFWPHERTRLLNQVKQKFQQCLEDKKQQFARKQFTQQWKIGTLSNFQYLCLINQYSGRSTNDLAQYYVFPWVVVNYNGKNGFNQLDDEFLKNKDNLRNLAFPPGKLSSQKFNKLKTRLMQLDFCQPQQRFLYGTMFSNPTVLYNFFIRLQPYIHLHWEHQGKRIDHADRLFFSIQEQFNSILIASSDMKELTPQFYYWPQFLKNRSYIDLGQKQNKQEVDNVLLPPWAHTPEQFIFKMRYALQSNVVSQHLNQWIDLTFGYKIKYQNAEKNDNLYHFNCYQRSMDYFQQFADDQRQIRSLQVSISEFGQVPEALFDEPHPVKNLRHQFLIIDRFIKVNYEKLNLKNNMVDQIGFETCKQGIFIWTPVSVEFKKSYITQNYSYDEEHKVYLSTGDYSRVLSFDDQCWLTLNQGILRIYIKRVLKFQQSIQAQCMDIIGTYFIFATKSSLYIAQYDGLRNQLANKKVLYGHKDQIIHIACSKSLDLILSVDLEGFAILHELQNLSFMRNFLLPLEKQWPRNLLSKQFSKKNFLKVQIHEMGYLIFLINQKKLVIFTFLGEIYLQHEIQIVSEIRGKRQEQKINDVLIFRHDQSILLLGTDHGNIYELDFIQVKRYNQIYPFKIFTNIHINILDFLLSQHSSSLKSFKKLSTFSNKSQNQHNFLKSIERMTIEKIPGDRICLYQLIVQYEDGQILCFYEEKYLGKQLKQNQKLKQIGLFF